MNPDEASIARTLNPQEPIIRAVLGAENGCELESAFA